jgi:hypothetical protein
MLSYAMMIDRSWGVVVLVVAAIVLAARVRGGPEQMTLFRAARAAAAQRRLLAAAAQQLPNVYWMRCLKHQYEDALAAPLPPRLATLVTQLEKAAA